MGEELIDGAGGLGLARNGTYLQGTSIARPQYATGWRNTWNNTMTPSGELNTNQAVANQAYTRLNSDLASGSITPEQFDAGLATLNNGATTAMGDGAFNTVGGEIGSAVKGMDPKSGAGGAGGSVLGGLASAVNIVTNLANTFDKSAEKAAQKQLDIENARANEMMAMNREKYNTFKADKKRLGLAYGGN